MNSNQPETPGEGPPERDGSDPGKSVVVAPLCLALGGIGAFVAVIMEATTKSDVSITYKIRDAMTQLLEVPVPTVWVVVFLVCLGILVVFMSQTKDYYRAFYGGASILTIIITLVPTGLPPSPGTPDGNASNGDPAVEGSLPSQGFHLAAFALRVQVAQGPATVTVQISAKDDKPVREVVMTLRNARGGVEAKARYLGTRFRFSQRAGTYTMVLDSPGFKSVVRALELAPGESKVLDITLKPTWKPILLQKLFRAV